MHGLERGESLGLSKSHHQPNNSHVYMRKAEINDSLLSRVTNNTIRGCQPKEISVTDGEIFAT